MFVKDVSFISARSYLTDVCSSVSDQFGLNLMISNVLFVCALSTMKSVVSNKCVMYVCIIMYNVCVMYYLIELYSSTCTVTGAA